MKINDMDQILLWLQIIAIIFSFFVGSFFLISECYSSAHHEICYALCHEVEVKSRKKKRFTELEKNEKNVNNVKNEAKGTKLRKELVAFKLTKRIWKRNKIKQFTIHMHRSQVNERKNKWEE